MGFKQVERNSSEKPSYLSDDFKTTEHDEIQVDDESKNPDEIKTTKSDELDNQRENQDRASSRRKYYLIVLILTLCVIGLAAGCVLMHQTVESRENTIKEEQNKIKQMENYTSEMETSFDKLQELNKKIDVVISASGSGVFVADDDVMFWFVKRRSMEMTFTEASEFCKNHGSALPVIRNKKEYDEIVKMIRSALFYTHERASFWTGLAYNLGERAITPYGAFTEWESGFPENGIYQEKVFTNVVKNPQAAYQGMRNWVAGIRMDSALCQM